MQEVPLSNGPIVLVDDEDYERVTRWCWCALVRRGTACYAYRRDNVHKKAVLMHRFILDAPPHMHVDHIDSNGFNNVRANLRLCTRAQNQAHRLHLNKNNTSGYRGVYWQKDRQRWCVRVSLNGCAIQLGRYDDPVEAARVYDQWMREHHGEFAVLNFPGEDNHEHGHHGVGVRRSLD